VVERAHQAAGVHLAVVAEDDVVRAAARADDVREQAAEDHVGAGVARNEVGAGRLVVGAGGRDLGHPLLRIAPDLAVVADDHRAAGAGHDLVRAGAADDGGARVDAVAALDLVRGALAREGGADDAEGEQHLAVVADDDVAAAARLDVVAAGAAEDHVGARAAADLVLRAVGRVAAFDRGYHDLAAEAQGAEHRAAVAQDHVAPGAADDLVLARAADQDAAVGELGALAAKDVVVAAFFGRGGLDHAGEVGLAAVAEDDVAAEAGSDRVALGTAHDHVAAVAAGDGVDAADGVERGLHEFGFAVGQQAHFAVVADDDVVALGAGDGVVAAAADQDAARRAGGGAEHAGLDLVIAGVVAQAGAERLRLVEEAVVAEDHVAAQAGEDVVAAQAAEDHVGAVTALDGVDAAGLELVGQQLLERDVEVEAGEVVGAPRRGAQAQELDAVARDHVVAARAGERVVTGAADQDAAHRPADARAGDPVVAARQQVGGADRHHVVEARDLAGVAEDDVAAQADRDDVGTLAAHDHVAAGTAADVVGAAAGVVEGSDRDQAVGGVAPHVAAVADDHVVAVAARDLVAAGAAGDEVGGAEVRRGAEDVVRLFAAVVEHHAAGVAEDD